MQLKIGTDIVLVKRIEESIEKFGQKFLNRFLSQEEQQIAKKVETIAAFWAAKEAVAKALGCGIGEELSFLDIAISKDSKGAPHLRLTNEEYQIKSSSLSLSHDGGFAIAVVALIL